MDFFSNNNNIAVSFNSINI